MLNKRAWNWLSLDNNNKFNNYNKNQKLKIA